jgi:MFS family permease
MAEVMSTKPEGISPHVDEPELEEGVEITTTAHGPFGRTICSNYRLVAWALAALSGLLLYGYDFVIVGNITSLRAFQSDYGQLYDGRLIIPSLWFALWKAASPLGTMVGAMIGGFFSDRWGRRASIGVGSIVCAVGVAGCIGSAYTGSLTSRRSVFLAAKLVQGIGIGKTASTVQTYTSEIITPRLRGPAMSMIPLLTLLGHLIGAGDIAGQSGFKTRSAYVTPMMSMLAFTVLPLVSAFFMPESPVWSVKMGHTPSAERALIRLHGPNADISALLETIRNLVTSSQRSQARYTDCFKASERQRTLLVMMAHILPHFLGAALLGNASYFFQVMGMAERPSLLIVVAGIVLGILGNIGSLWTILIVGRRKLVIVGFSVTMVLWLAISIANCFQNTVTLWYATNSALYLRVIMTNVIVGLRPVRACWSYSSVD